ncbi:hypothetical protein G6O69_28995 [Pseudenhygromyxa sp. WMMC2535]|uniref:hypothetical protein n=1 Tax=Pseudenhygromyxa sp. WMMC2535 TaxID=2712867 RepID=UPI001554D9EF|nr:hypothetical protein [Pseudenhygromyxa sp. WMMC2535]NVB41903.1 hypothetical protein [Pseudenhygromyxa sp. WMMC2535]
MAHIVVYLQRTPRGLHPGSLVGLCLARDIANERGASVLGLCLGDAGAFDDRVVVEASRAGADQLVFMGPEGIDKLFRRIAPRHVLAPLTPDAEALLGQLTGSLSPCWVDGPLDSDRLAHAIAVIAGSLPWHQTPLQVEPEYEADVTQVKLPEWLDAASAAATDLTRTVEQPPLLYVSSETPDAQTLAALEALGAYASDAAAVAEVDAATVLWLDAKGEGLPQSLSERQASVRVILLAGERELSSAPDPSWALADFVLHGPLAQTVREFNGQAWKLMFA